MRVRDLISWAVLPSFLVSCGGDASTTSPVVPGPVAQMVIVTGDSQEGVVGEELSDPLVVRATDADDVPVPGQLVNFVVTSGGGSVFAGSSITNDQGEARERWTLGTSTAESQEAEARAVDSETGEKLVFETFEATPLAAASDTMMQVRGNGQSGPVGERLVDSLIVQVTDRYGNPISEVTVDWSVEAGGGAVDPRTAITDSEGSASTEWTLGNIAGDEHLVHATSEGVKVVEFAATGEIAGGLQRLAGNEQTDTAMTTLADSVVVSLQLDDGSPVVGATITFTVRSGGGSVSPNSVETNSSGEASASWTLGQTAGSNELIVSGDGLDSIRFTATAMPGRISRVDVTPDSVVLVALDDTIHFSADAYDQFENQVTSAVFSWTSSDPNIASIDSLGVTRAEANGAALIRAISDDVADSANILVDQEPAIVAVSPQADTINAIGDSVQISSEVFDANGFEISEYTIIWESADDEVITVDPSGIAVSKDVGDVEIIGIVDQVVDTASIVSRQVAADIVINPAQGIVGVSDTIRFVAAVSDSNGIAIFDPGLVWRSSDSLIVTVDSMGLVSGRAPGTASVIAELDGVEGDAIVEAKRQLAFMRLLDGDQEIFLIFDDGTGLRQLTDNDLTDSHPDWSPEGSRIAFHRMVDPRNQIFVMNGDGSQIEQLTQIGIGGGVEPRWSPDGSRIAFRGSEEGRLTDIYVMGADGSNIKRITDDPADDISPSWSPDGSRIAFVSTRGGNNDIYIMDADGGNVTQVTTDPGSDGSPAWSPNAEEIAFSSSRSGDAEIYIIRIDGTDLRRITTSPGVDTTPAWFSDGSRIAFVSKRDGDLNIYIVNTDGTNLVQVTNDPRSDGHPSWRP